MCTRLYEKYVYLKEINDDRFRKYLQSDQVTDRENPKNDSTNSRPRKQNKKARIKKRF